ncbi:MAG: LysR family transcriptional regulator [Sulfurospirillaceae bacterium]|nr:LysR family transcriptional regulator [Sulfurospirillaceae bacterium]
MISIKHMEYFIAVAETRQISKAAAKLKISQSTITMAIKGLEDMLNTQLMTRYQKGIELTYDGNLFLEHSKRIISSIEEMMDITNQKNLLIKGELTVAMSFTISGYFIAGYYAKFVRSFPNVKIRIIEADRADIEEGLINGTYDIGLFDVANIENIDELEYETIISSKRRLWLSAGHKLLKKSSVTLQEISEEPYIMITVDEASKVTQRYWNNTPYRPNVIYRTNSIEAVRSMVANGSGIAILADMVYRPWSLEGRRVETVNVVEEIPSWDVGIVWATDREKSQAAISFQKFMNLTVNSMKFPKKLNID